MSGTYRIAAAPALGVNVALERVGASCGRRAHFAASAVVTMRPLRPSSAATGPVLAAKPRQPSKIRSDLSVMVVFVLCYRRMP
jgi:hypothetical protein